MALIKSGYFEKPFVLDIFKVNSGSVNQYDLPFYYMGQVMNVNFEYDTPPSLSPLGPKHGYQHLYLEGAGKPVSKTSSFSWMGDRRFYTLTSVAADTDELFFTRIGANDGDFNLRREPAFIIRRNEVKDTVFASVIESHGSYNPVTENAVNSNSSILELTIVHDDENYTAVSILDTDERMSLFVLSNTDASRSKNHELEYDGKTYRWRGPYHYFDAK